MRAILTALLGVGAILLLFMMRFGGGFQEFILHEPVLGQIGGLPYVTFFSTKSPSTTQNCDPSLSLPAHNYLNLIADVFLPLSDHPRTTQGYWSVAKLDGKSVVVPGRVGNAPAQMVFTTRGRMPLLGIKSDSWYNAGLLEGFVLADDIQQALYHLGTHYKLISDAWFRLRGQKLATFEQVQSYLKKQVSWTNNHAKSTSESESNFKASLRSVMEHLQGIADGYNMRFKAQIQKKTLGAITLNEMFLLNSIQELLDIGAHVSQQPLSLDPKHATKESKKLFGSAKSNLVALLLSGRVSALMAHLVSPVASDAMNLTQIKTVCDNQAWYPFDFPRPFVRISIDSSRGFQHISLPGSVVSMDSFSVTLTAPKLASVVMRQAEFTDAHNQSDYSGFISGWMIPAAAFHTPNLTASIFNDYWKSSQASMISKGWKTLLLESGHLSELQFYSDTSQTADLTATLLKDDFILTMPTQTLLKDEARKIHGFDSIGWRREKGIQLTDIDPYQHESIRNAIQNSEPDIRELLTGSTSITLQEVILELRHRFELTFMRTEEYFEIQIPS